MSSTTRKPQIQYGKKAQRSNAKRMSVPVEVMLRKEDMSPQRTVSTKINTPTSPYRSLGSPTKAGPSNGKRVVEYKDDDESTEDESPDELEDKPRRPRRPSRGPYSTSLLASTLKRKATLEEVSSGVESDDTLRLGYVPRKKTKMAGE
jgi:hypothetical protein